MKIFLKNAALREYVAEKLHQENREQYVDRRLDQIEDFLHKLEWRVSCLEGRLDAHQTPVNTVRPGDGTGVTI